VVRVVQDLLCFEDFGYDIPVYDCKHVSVTLSHLYWAIVTFMCIVTLATGTLMADRLKAVVTVAKAAFLDQSAKPKTD
ncbi:hypothetical protein DYB28_015407, partial [Aphanomyces astaci]